MKKYFLLVLFLALFWSVNDAGATVGGPTYINNFKYNPKDESVYYTQNDHGGRGCPPVLMKISLVDGKNETVYSCEKGEELLNAYLNNNYEFGLSKVREEINNIVSGFKDLNPIDLRKENINIDLNFEKSEKFPEDPEYVKNSVFNMTTYKDGKKVKENLVYGCNMEQPFTFAGYAIPGFDKKIVILLSTKGDCFEGGYIYESLIVVGGLDNLKKEYSNFYKGDGPLVPNEGTLTLYASDKVTTDNDKIDGEQQEKDQSEPDSKYLLSNELKVIALVSFAVFVTLGFFMGRVL